MAVRLKVKRKADMAEIADYLAFYLQTNSPRQTGALRRSWQSRASGDTGVVYSRLPWSWRVRSADYNRIGRAVLRNGIAATRRRYPDVQFRTAQNYGAVSVTITRRGA